MHGPDSSLRFNPAEWLEHLPDVADRLPFHPYVLAVDPAGERGLADGRLVGDLRARIHAYGGSSTEEFFSSFAFSSEPSLLFLATLVLQRLVHARSGLPRLVELPVPYHVPAGEVRVFPGNTIMEGACKNEGLMVVAGDLMLQGLYEDTNPDAILCVSGEAAVAYLATQGWVAVGGDVNAEILCTAQSDTALSAGGTLSAYIALREQHAIEAETLEVRHSVSLDERGDETLRSLLHPELFGAGSEGRFAGVGALLARLRSGEPVVREPLEG